MAIRKDVSFNITGKICLCVTKEENDVYEEMIPWVYHTVKETYGRSFIGYHYISTSFYDTDEQHREMYSVVGEVMIKGSCMIKMDKGTDLISCMAEKIKDMYPEIYISQIDIKVTREYNEDANEICDMLDNLIAKFNKE